MRILIFGLPRCGTTSLFNFLMSLLPNNYVSKYEPYKKERYFFENNLLVKTVLSDRELLESNETLEEHSIKIIQEYDKVIFLIRKDINNIKDSFYKMREKNFIEKHEIDYQPVKKNTDKQIDRWLKIFNSVSNKSNTYYYEDLFTETPSIKLKNLLDYLNIEYKELSFQKFIHPKNREIDIKKNSTIL